MSSPFVSPLAPFLRVNPFSSSPPLPVTREHIIRQRRQRIALAARREGGEALLGTLGVFNGARIGQLGGPRFLQQPQQLAPLLGGDRALGDDRADERVGLVVAALTQKDDRQRDLALAQVTTNGLAQRLLVGGVVEQVVHQLKGHPEVESVVAQRGLALRPDVTEQAADLRAATEEERGLATNDLEVLLFGDVDISRLRELIELTFDHAERDVAEQAHQIERVVRERERHRLDVQVVAEQDRDVVAPARMGGQPAAAHVGAVDDVVVYQRGGVNELHDRRIEHGAVASVSAQSRSHQQHRGAHALAAAFLYVPAHLGDQRDARLDVLYKLLLDGFEILTDRLEDLGKIGGGGVVRCIAQGGGSDRLGLTILEFRA